ncbi:hypothetical protein AB4Y40_38950 [Paraburkholderia sp. EG287B]|uniref:hypothetical protein n=1 Tax=unclassified Paraburkholderia TaxID=2615204 RepID=UPI0034D2041E
MTVHTPGKIQARHLSRNAYLYVRQSTLRQVFENTESTERQYALRENKAQRGELEIRLPIGFVYDGEGSVSLDPDQRIQESIREFFLTFRRTASAMATVKAFRRAGLKFPRRIYRGPHKGDVQWDELDHSRAL